MITPYPIKTDVLDGVHGLMQYQWAQWLTGLLAGLNLTPGNSLPVKFADLPVPVEGMFLTVTDSTVNTWGTAITIGGGGFRVGAYYNGTQWTVAAK